MMFVLTYVRCYLALHNWVNFGQRLMSQMEFAALSDLNVLADIYIYSHIEI